jgi:hypothetical protein
MACQPIAFKTALKKMGIRAKKRAIPALSD